MNNRNILLLLSEVKKMASFILLCTSILLSLTVSNVCSFKNLNFLSYLENELAPEGKIWALLVAGSDSWFNYRHQADVCHAYQVLHNHGIPDEQIVVMMKDDLANNPENPTKGIIINHPNGSDVYKGVPHDYTGMDVTPKNFLNVLQGNASSMSKIGSGKVIESGPNDHVFVYFADHGAPGLIAFPESMELTATRLNKAINNMYLKKKYSKMVLYIEACESGSMFNKLLPKNINVYATTAANPTESSYACYYDEDRETYLGDVYSVKWLEDSDKEQLTQETLKKQFQIVKSETNTSHVKEYGDLTIGNMHVSEFQGSAQSTPIVVPKVPYDAVSSREVPVAILKKKLLKAKSPDQKQELQKRLHKMLRNRNFLTRKMMSLINMLAETRDHATQLWKNRRELNDFDCYETVIKHFDKECFNLSKNSYALEFLYLFVNMCEDKLAVDDMKSAMEQVCTHPAVYDIV